MESGTSANHMDMESATYKNQTLKIRTAHLTNCCTEFTLYKVYMFFPTRQVRVVRFYVSCLLPSFLPFFLVVVLSALNREPPCPVFPAGPALQRPRPSGRSVPCRTNCDLLCPVFPAGPQPRPSALSVPCRTSTAR